MIDNPDTFFTGVPPYMTKETDRCNVTLPTYVFKMQDASKESIFALRRTVIALVW